MTDEKTKVKSGVTVSKEAVFIGDFVFKFQGNLIKQYKEWKDACNGDVSEYEQTVKELMAKHYAFYGQFQKENKYVKSGSVLWCSGGSKLTAFDILHDHGVVQKDGTPIGICTDCKANENIYTFEGCKIPAPAGYPERPVVTVKSQPQATLHKCIPMLNGSWSKSKSSKIKIWDESTGKYADAVTTGDFLTCFYGGIIDIVEVPTVNGTKRLGNEYLTLEQMKSLGWNKIHCGYKVVGTGKDSPMNDMSSEIERKHREINQGDIDKINSLLEKYQIDSKERICAFFAECAAETSNGYRFLEGPGLNKYPFTDTATRTNINKWFDTYREYGSKYRGGGAIQLTWDYHYTEFKNWMKKEFDITDLDIVNKGAEYIAINYPWEAAVFYWSKSNLNSKADTGDIHKVTAVVNPKMTNAEYKLREDAYNLWMQKYVFPF
jgi:predicted chitinase